MNRLLTDIGITFDCTTHFIMITILDMLHVTLGFLSLK